LNASNGAEALDGLLSSLDVVTLEEGGSVEAATQSNTTSAAAADSK
jgi:hypothetical protein